jgi:hypothetical protein
MAEKEISIREITTNDLRGMNDREGIVFEGCADLPGWVEGINETLKNEGILLNGSKLENVSSFQRGGLTCLLFDFEGAELNIGKFAMWRLQTHGQLGGTWLSDYVPNRLGGFIQKRTEKPDCELIGQEGNIFNLMGIASRTLKECGMEKEAAEMAERITGGDCHDYYAALGIIGEYVNITGPAEQASDLTMKMEM